MCCDCCLDVACIYIFVVSTLIDQIGAPVNNTQQAFSKNYFTQTTTKKVKIQWRQFFVVFNRFQVFAIRSYVFFSFCLFYKKLLFNQLHNVYREKTSGDFMRFWICLILNGAGFFDFVNHCVSLLWMKLVKSYLVHNRLIISHSVFFSFVCLFHCQSFRFDWFGLLHFVLVRIHTKFIQQSSIDFGRTKKKCM